MPIKKIERHTLGIKHVNEISKKHNFDHASVSKKYKIVLKEIRAVYPKLSEVQKTELKRMFLENPNVSSSKILSVFSIMASRGKI